MLCFCNFYEIVFFRLNRGPSIAKKSQLLKYTNFLKLKMNNNFDEIENVLAIMPESFLSDRRRPNFLSLPILQRLGKLNQTKEKNNEQTLKKTYHNEINHEFRFISIEKSSIKSEKSLLNILGMNMEDNLIDASQFSSKGTKKKSYRKKTRNRNSITDTISTNVVQMTFSTILLKKSVNWEKLIVSICLITSSILSLI
jgi:hypothetical protein